MRSHDVITWPQYYSKFLIQNFITFMRDYKKGIKALIFPLNILTNHKNTANRFFTSICLT